MIDLIRSLLDLVTPHCDICPRPATRFEGSYYGTEDPTAPRRYRCDAHPAEGGRWSDLPGAGVVRRTCGIVGAT